MLCFASRPLLPALIAGVCRAGLALCLMSFGAAAAERTPGAGLEAARAHAGNAVPHATASGGNSSGSFIASLDQSIGTTAGDMRAAVGSIPPDQRPVKAKLVGAFLSSDDKKCTNAVWRPWPYSQDDVVNAINAARSWMASNNSRLRKSRILLLDSGFDFADGNDVIPADYLEKIAVWDSDKGTKVMAVGENLVTRSSNFSTFKQDQKDRWHGLEVASVALGGTLLETFRRQKIDNEPALPIRLFFGNAEHLTESGLEISEASLPEAISVANQTDDLAVINASLEIYDDDDAWQDRRQSFNGADKVVVIAAAGNESVDIRQQPTYPAIWGGGSPMANQPLIVVTVGAEDSNGELANWSRYGRQHVDLLAPGCNIQTYEADEADNQLALKSTTLAGTSFAAPLVSFTAALLYAEDIHPLEIKSRLLTSTDFNPALLSKVYSSGVLNIPKAISVWGDIVEFNEPNAKPHLGLVDDKMQNVVNICNVVTTLDQILKIAIAKDAKGKRQAIVWQKQANAMNGEFEEPSRCEVDDDRDKFEFHFLDWATGQRTTVNLQNLRDFVTSIRAAGAKR